MSLPPLPSPLLHYNGAFQPSATTANPISIAPVASISSPTIASYHLPLFPAIDDFPALFIAAFSHALLSAVLTRMTTALFFLCVLQPHPS
ncbi:hypothetical protein B296_00027212 [Ensete ventricosum]|uniref:Uncharacterized protein n=1 Tax=Ensete ventricosum TaxID=4639 RepID=A0A426Y2L9_ENSVE|nr:hypothetical protein B296_00027212 [Ensete ventricosum]